MRSVCVIVGTLAVAFLVAAPCAAEELMKLPPEMRLLHGRTEIPVDADVATVAVVDIQKLPATVLTQVKNDLALCLGDPTLLASELRAYSWSSPARKFGASYVIDFARFAGKPSKKACEKDPVCDEVGCFVKGYTTLEGKSWKQDFEIRAAGLFFIPPSESGQDRRTLIGTLSNREDCESDGGIETEKGCLRKFAWRQWGLALVR